MSNVVDFDPNRRRKGRQPALPPEHQALHWRARPAAPGARELAAKQASTARGLYQRALNRQERERLLREGTPVPARITMALDLGGHEGPEVDVACGAVEPAVDLWECGLETPTAEQVELLSKLTGFPVTYFYMPVEPGPLLGTDLPIWVCGPRGCEATEQPTIDERGVLHYAGERRQPPEGWQGALW